MGLLTRFGIGSSVPPEQEPGPAICGGSRDHFEAVREALASGTDAEAACADAGRDSARRGVSLPEALGGLRAATLHARGTDPRYDDVVALAQAWSETTLAYLHQLSCADPLTGLATLAHLRTRLGEVYRAGELGGGRTGSDAVRESHALVVIDVARVDPDGPWESSRVMARLGADARTVFAGEETIASLRECRVGVLTARDDNLARRVGLLRRLANRAEGAAAPPVRVWIEGLPGTEQSATALLDELTRI